MPAAALGSFIPFRTPVRTRPARINGRQCASEGILCPPAQLTDALAGSRIDAPKARLASAVLVSAMLHMALVAGLALPTAYPVIPASPAPLSVRLVQASDGGVVAIPQTRLPAAIPRLNESDAPTRAARFLAAPDLSVLEVVPVRLPGKAVLRLQVSASGIVERVTLIRNDPAPKELIDGLLAAFAATRLAPAQIGDQPTASSVEVTVRFEPGLLPIEPDQN